MSRPKKLDAGKLNPVDQPWETREVRDARLARDHADGEVELAKMRAALSKKTFQQVRDSTTDTWKKERILIELTERWIGSFSFRSGHGTGYLVRYTKTMAWLVIFVSPDYPVIIRVKRVSGREIGKKHGQIWVANTMDLERAIENDRPFDQIES